MKELDLGIKSQEEAYVLIRDMNAGKLMLVEAEEISGLHERKMNARNEMRWITNEVLRQLEDVQDWSVAKLKLVFMNENQLVNFVENINETECSVEDVIREYGRNDERYLVLKALAWLSFGASSILGNYGD
jgi:hypothetical protein